MRSVAWSPARDNVVLASATRATFVEVKRGLWLYSKTGALRHHVLRGVTDVVARDRFAYAHLANGRTAVVDLASGGVRATSRSPVRVLGSS